MTKEEAERRRQRGDSALGEVSPLGVAISQRTSLQQPASDAHASNSLDVDRSEREKLAAKSPPGSPMAVEHTMAQAQQQVDRETSDKGRRRSEEEKPSRTLLTAEDARGNALLPVVSEENGEGSSRGGSVSGTQSEKGGRRGSTKESEDSKERERMREEKERDREDVARELKRQGSEGIRIVESNPGETDFMGYEKVSVQMPSYGSGHSNGDGGRHSQVDGAADDLDGMDGDEFSEEDRRKYTQPQGQKREKPPRINSDIIPPFSPFDAADGLGWGGSDPEKRQSLNQGQGQRGSLR
jgi:hypothetical protein